MEEPLQTESEVPVLELSEDLSNFQNRIPAYVKSRPVSKESLKPATGFFCDLCDRFIASDALAQVKMKCVELRKGYFVSFLGSSEVREALLELFGGR